MRYFRFPLLFFVFFIVIMSLMYSPVTTAGDMGSNSNPGEISTDWDIDFVVMQPLDDNFKVMLPHINSCTPYPYLKNRLIGSYINSSAALYVRATVYIGCNNVSDTDVEVLQPKITGDENFKRITVPVSVYTNLPLPFPLELRSNKVSISYEYHNSTHFFILMKFLNITLSPDLESTFGTSNPASFGWPKNMTLRFIVNKETGDSYLLDNGKKRYVGVLPLYLPEFNPKHYLLTIKENAFNFVQSVKSNPWVVASVAQKAKLTNSTRERDEIINEAAMNFSERILNVDHRYLGLPIKIQGEVVLGSSANRGEEVKEIRANVTAILSSANTTRKAVLEYLKTGNKEGILNLVNRTLYIRREYLPPAFIKVQIPPVNVDDQLPLPLPEEYSNMLGAKYIYLLLERNTTKYPYVHYDPRIFDPNKISKEWNSLRPFISVLYSDVYSNMTNILYSGITEGDVNYTQFDELYQKISSMIDEYFKVNYGEIPKSEKIDTTSEGNMEIAKDQISSANPASETTMTKKKDICGPAFIVPLALIPVWAWRKRK
ncbi:CGP-CTERM sorting domain-containing protein [Thermococcus sp. Bubb.Bath]|uniref:CGP-CTERM sorting domain-containing protein n=1 Tax=Thermococcus sp. Bubb.Bath TaxID=1638242 RepID=UPI00143C536F|nr:CGP-CTERM sorting domain-containing protein [Thermococcus sp. Bubb.Bath]NJF24479.1 CGP-CTERM sorting domain-containing protein [Thermococcus sp. Bubb.Bath]